MFAASVNFVIAFIAGLVKLTVIPAFPCADITSNSTSDVEYPLLKYRIIPVPINTNIR